MKYNIDYTNVFKKQYKKMIKQGKDINKLIKVIKMLANGTELDINYKNHKLINNNYFDNCYKCHIEPDWSLVYKMIIVN